MCAIGLPPDGRLVLVRIARGEVRTALDTLSLPVPEALELLLEAVQLVIRAALQGDEAGTRMVDRAEEFIQLQVQGTGIPILCPLNEKHDEERDDGGPRINDQL